MKRIITAILVLTVAAALLVLPAAAAGNSRIQLSSQALAEGDKLEITYFLSGYAQVDTIGITFSIPEGLKLESAEWLLEEGIIKNVNIANCQAAWANDKSLDLSEETAVLRITCIAEKSSAGGMQIDISAVVKKGSAEQGQTAAQAQVKPPMAASAVSLNKDTLSLDLNGTGTFMLTAELSPAEATDKVVWSCDDSGVVKVSQDGTVTALKKGTAKVTATAGSASKSCTVTVTCSHDLKETPAKAPTCQAAGNKQYFTCIDCGTVLAADKRTETTVDQQKLEITGHTGGEASCSALAKCEHCGKAYGQLLPHAYGEEWIADETHHWHLCTICQTAKAGKAEHSYQWVTDREPTQLEAGVKHEQCECGAKRNENTAIPKLEHSHDKLQFREGVEPTCTTPGTVAHYYCQICQKYYATARNSASYSFAT